MTSRRRIRSIRPRSFGTPRERILDPSATRQIGATATVREALGDYTTHLEEMVEQILVLLLISNARNSVSMFFEPSAHFVIGPSPFNRLGVAVVVFGSCRHDVLNEFVPTVP
jgi:hypothetical protein